MSDAANDDDLGPPQQVLGRFGRDYRLTMRLRRYLDAIDAVYVISVFPWVFVMETLGGWSTWGHVAITGLFLRFALIKIMLVHFGVEGTNVPVPERKRRIASVFDQTGLVAILWTMIACLVAFAALIAYGIATEPKSLAWGLWVEVSLLFSIALLLWLIMTTRRFIRKWVSA